MGSPSTRQSAKSIKSSDEKLQRWMDELQQKHRLKTVIIDMEPTADTIGGTSVFCFSFVLVNSYSKLWGSIYYNPNITI
jgi:hypothetical protein